MRAAWSEAGREAAPRLVALGYYALGPDGGDAAHRYLTDYNAFLGPFAERIAEGALVEPNAVHRTIAEFAAEGCDELILFPYPRPGPG